MFSNIELEIIYCRCEEFSQYIKKFAGMKFEKLPSEFITFASRSVERIGGSGGQVSGPALPEE